MWEPKVYMRVHTCKCLPIISPPPYTHTHTVSLRIIMLAGGQQTNGFVGFLVQARNYTDMFVPESSIHGTWEDDGNLLYRPLVCGKSMANTSVLYPVSLPDMIQYNACMYIHLYKSYKAADINCTNYTCTCIIIFRTRLLKSYPWTLLI